MSKASNALLGALYLILIFSVVFFLITCTIIGAMYIFNDHIIEFTFIIKLIDVFLSIIVTKYITKILMIAADKIEKEKED